VSDPISRDFRYSADFIIAGSAGVETDTCVDSTGRDAYFLDYYVTFVADCCGAASEEDHRGVLERFSRDYGQAVVSGDVISIWNADAAHDSSPTPASAST
jgi:ureidoacrylate peracid hydrolase